MSLKTAAIGLGAMGRHHARHLAIAEGSTLVACCDPDEARAGENASKWEAAAITDPAQLPDDLDAAIIAAPTTLHREIAEPLLRRGVHCLVEKPIAVSVEEADALIAAAEAGGAVLMIGHAERFNPGLTRVRDRIAEPRFVEADRLGVFPARSLDVDVVLDLMIHDMDLLCWLTGSEPVEIQAVGLDVLTPRVDIANARVTFGSGCTADVTASRVSNEITRKMRIFDRSAYLSIDFVAQAAEIVTLEMGEGAPKIDRQHFGPAGEDEKEEPLFHEIAAFLAAVRGEAAPAVTGADGRRALAGTLGVLEAMEAHRKQAAELRGRHRANLP
jgi:predicted dehydrogenase